MSATQGEMFEVTAGNRKASMSSTAPVERTPESYLPLPPSGPQAERYSVEEGLPSALTAFMEGEDGPPFWRALEAAALDALARQETRFSPRGFLVHYRDTKRVRINNNFSPWFADLLLMEHPQLVGIVERRVRKAAGPTP